MISINNLSDYKKAIQLAIKAAKSYYNSDEVILDDHTYDNLILEIKNYELANPDKIIEHNIFTAVAAGTSVSNDVYHNTPMLSLDNIFSEEDLQKWLDKYDNKTIFTVESKFDGLSLSLHYTNGVLNKLATRGDGERGEDVTYSIDKLVNLPKIIDIKDNIEVRGEVLFTREEFIKANELRVNSEMKPYANARNAASGALRAEKLSYRVNLSFVAHGVIGLNESSHYKAMKKLKEYGFSLGDNNFEIKEYSKSEVINAINTLSEKREKLIFETDGAVIKVSDYNLQKELGFTAKSPRWAIAFKYPANEVHGIIDKIELQVGRQGTITPVAKIKPPVRVGGVTISSITLHNFEEINRKDIRIGDTVNIHRAGEVIPEIIGVVFNLRKSNAKKYQPPKKCPNCNSEINKNMKRWSCTNVSDCATLPMLIYAFSRDALDIQGLGDKVVKVLYDNNLLNKIEDIFNLNYDNLSKLPRFADKSINNLLKNIEDSKRKPFYSFITALGLSQTGKELSKRLADHFRNIDNLLNATVQDMIAIEGIAEDRAAAIISDLPRVKNTLLALKSHNINFIENISVIKNNSLAGKSISVTGSDNKYSRIDIKQIIEENGGTFIEKVNKKVTILLTGDKPSNSKINFANINNIKIMKINDFFDAFID